MQLEEKLQEYELKKEVNSRSGKRTLNVAIQDRKSTAMTRTYMLFGGAQKTWSKIEVTLPLIS